MLFVYKCSNSSSFNHWSRCQLRREGWRPCRWGGHIIVNIVFNNYPQPTNLPQHVMSRGAKSKKLHTFRGLVGILWQDFNVQLMVLMITIASVLVIITWQEFYIPLIIHSQYRPTQEEHLKLPFIGSTESWHQTQSRHGRRADCRLISTSSSYFQCVTVD